MAFFFFLMVISWILLLRNNQIFFFVSEIMKSSLKGYRNKIKLLPWNDVSDFCLKERKWSRESLQVLCNLMFLWIYYLQERYLLHPLCLPQGVILIRPGDEGYVSRCIPWIKLKNLHNQRAWFIRQCHSVIEVSA